LIHQDQTDYFKNFQKLFNKISCNYKQCLGSGFIRLALCCQGPKYQPKTEKNNTFFTLQTQIWNIETRDYKNFLIQQKNKTNWKFCYVKKFRRSYKKWLGSGSIFLSADPGSGSTSAPKLNGSLALQFTRSKFQLTNG